MLAHRPGNAGHRSLHGRRIRVSGYDGKQRGIYLDYDASALLVDGVKELKIENELQLQEIRQLQQALTEVKDLLARQTPGDQALSARLWQNFPNPFSQTTTVRYHVPESASEAQLVVYTSAGQELYRMQITGRGQGELELSDRYLLQGLATTIWWSMARVSL